MADNAYDTLTLVGRHVPEPMLNAQGNPASPQELGHDTVNPVTGTYEIGAMIGGAFVPIITEKASLVFDAIALAKDQADAAQAQPASESQPQPAASEQPQAAAASSDQPQPDAQPDTGPLSGQAADQPQG
jgi:hypothetical protein